MLLICGILHHEFYEKYQSVVAAVMRAVWFVIRLTLALQTGLREVFSRQMILGRRVSRAGLGGAARSLGCAGLGGLV